MGTHPIFESDFDCLTDWNHKNTFKKVCIPPVIRRRSRGLMNIAKAGS